MVGLPENALIISNLIFYAKLQVKYDALFCECHFLYVNSLNIIFTTFYLKNKLAVYIYIYIYIYIYTRSRLSHHEEKCSTVGASKIDLFIIYIYIYIYIYIASLYKFQLISHHL